MSNFARQSRTPVPPPSNGGTFLQSRSLIKIDSSNIPISHPVYRAVKLYRDLRGSSTTRHMPCLETLAERLHPDITGYCLFMLPVSVDGALDFEILHQGRQLPGAIRDENASKYYSENVMPTLFTERALELTTCLALREESITQGTAARASALDMKVYRALLPVWKNSSNQHAVILVTAPLFAS